MVTAIIFVALTSHAGNLSKQRNFHKSATHRKDSMRKSTIPSDALETLSSLTRRQPSTTQIKFFKKNEDPVPEHPNCSRKQPVNWKKETLGFPATSRNIRIVKAYQGVRGNPLSKIQFTKTAANGFIRTNI